MISELNSLLFTKQCHAKKKICEDACNGAYSVNFMDDSELLDFRSAFNHCLSLGTCELIKQYAKHFHT